MTLPSSRYRCPEYGISVRVYSRPPTLALTASKQRMPCAVTSGPMPSPAIIAIFNIFTLLSTYFRFRRDRLPENRGSRYVAEQML